MRSILIALIPLCVLAAPTPNKVVITLANLLSTEDKFSLDDLNYYIGIFDNPSFKNYIPVPLQQLYADMTPDEKNICVVTINKVEDGSITIPNDPVKILNYISNSSPSIRARIDKVLDWVSNINAPDDVKQKIQQRIAEGISAASGDNKTRANRIARFIWNVYSAWTQEPTAFKDAVAATSPEARNLLDSRFAAAFAKAAKAFADSGYTADIHQLSATADFSK